MSSAVSFDMLFVKSSLISLGHLACVLIEHHADVVLPYCCYYNPGWEVELGTAEVVLEYSRTFARQINPVVNGICNMEEFGLIKPIRTEIPTVVMLSHVQYVKDIKNTIMATDSIVNRWGSKHYRLHIYGDMERTAGYSTECQQLVASESLGEHCVLKGPGNASLVLQNTWVFLNLSISKGLPLARGKFMTTGSDDIVTRADTRQAKQHSRACLWYAPTSVPGIVSSRTAQPAGNSSNWCHQTASRSLARKSKPSHYWGNGP